MPQVYSQIQMPDKEASGLLNGGSAGNQRDDSQSAGGKKMIIRQEEETPIGNHFHDNGTLRLFSKISDIVDEFEVDTERLKLLCDEMAVKMKELKGFVCSVEKAEIKKSVQKEVQDLSCNQGF